MKRFLLSSAFAMCLIGLLPPLAVAQFETASVLGYVRDGSGAALANATVTLTNQETSVSQNAQSNSDGNYTFVSVAPGTYKITAVTAGLRP